MIKMIRTHEENRSRPHGSIQVVADTQDKTEADDVRRPPPFHDMSGYVWISLDVALPPENGERRRFVVLSDQRTACAAASLATGTRKGEQLT